MRVLFVILIVAAGIGLFVWQQGAEGALGEVLPEASVGGPAGEGAQPLTLGAARRVEGPERSSAQAPASPPATGDAADPMGATLERAVSVEVELAVHRSDHTTAGMRVEVELVGPAGNGQRVAGGMTDAAGKFQAQCTLNYPVSEDPPRLRARVRQTGFTEKWGALSTGDGGASYAGRVDLQKGQTLRGHLIDGDGLPLLGRVSLYRLDRGNGDVRYVGHACKTSKEDGRFAYHAAARAWESSGEPSQLVLVGRAPGLGTAALVDFETAGLDQLNAIELVVRGPGEIRGRLTDGAGEAVPGAKLTLASVHLESGGSGGKALASKALGALLIQREMAGEGFEREETVTGADGGFRYAGLRPGEYRIHTTSDLEGQPWVPKDRTRRVLLTPEPVRAGTPGDPARSLELTLERRQLVVTLLRADGSPWTGPTHVAESWFVLMHGESDQWSQRPSVSVTEQPGRTSRYGRDLGEGRFAFAISDVDSLEVVVMGGELGGMGFPVEARTVGVDRGANTIHVEFRAVPRIPGGTLRLTGTVTERSSMRRTFLGAGQRAQAEDAPKSVFGAPIPRAEVEDVQEGFYLASHELEILDVATGRALRSANSVVQLPGTGGMALPEGRYRVAIRPLHSGETFMGPQCGGASAEVSIADGEAAIVRLDVDAGSTVRPYLDFGDASTAASVWLEDGHGHKTDLSHNGGRFNSWSWPSRRPIQSNVVTSGLFTLHAKTDTKHVSQSVVLKPRECLDVILR